MNPDNYQETKGNKTNLLYWDTRNLFHMKEIEFADYYKWTVIHFIGLGRFADHNLNELAKNISPTYSCKLRIYFFKIMYKRLSRQFQSLFNCGIQAIGIFSTGSSHKSLTTTTALH